MFDFSKLHHLALFGAALASLFSCSPSVPPGVQGESSPRNVVIICIDTVREDTFWLPEELGFADSFTPWATRAVTFRSVQTPAPWTVPAVSSLFTSLYPDQHGGGTFRGAVANLDVDIPNVLPERVETIAEMLRRQNYRTIGYIANHFIDKPSGVTQGFLRTTLMDAEKAAPASVRWIERSGRARTPAPFFLYVHLMEAHEKHWLDAATVSASAAGLPEALRNRVGRDSAGDICHDQNSLWCLRYKAYTRTVLDSRNSVASILSALDKAGLLSSTIVVLYSDHGEEFQDHQAVESRRASDPRNMSGAGHGHAMFQELLEVPLLIWHPNERPRDVTTPVSLIDIVPTLAEWLGIPKNEVWQGVSLADLDALSESRLLRERPLYSSGIAYGPDQVAVRRTDWKAVRHFCPPEDELFNLASDPREIKPLVESEMSGRLASLLTGYDRLPSFAEEKTAVLTPAQIEQLRSLGYLQGRNAGAERLSRCTDRPR